MTRKSKVTRKTAETEIELEIDLDGSGKAEVDTGIGFFDHMLISFAKHGLFDLKVTVNGDLHVDCHHTIERQLRRLSVINAELGDSEILCFLWMKHW